MKDYKKNYSKDVEFNDVAKNQISIEKLINIFENKIDREITELGKSKRKEDVRLQNAFIFITKEYVNCKNIEISRIMNISQNSVSRTLAK